MTRTGIASAAVAVVLGMAPVQGQDKATPHGRTDTRTFIHDMAIANMAEVQLGKIAAERAEDAGVKAFGQMMVTDHTQAGSELKQVASQLDVTVPTELDRKHRDLAEKLSKLQGGAFDREYIAAMVEGHQEVAAKLRARVGHSTSTARSIGDRASVSGSSTPAGSTPRPPEDGQRSATRPSVKPEGAARTQHAAGELALNQWATKTLPAVERHLSRARELQQKVGK